MFFYNLFSHILRTIPRTTLLSAQRIPQQQFHTFSNQFHSLIILQPTNKLIPFQVNFLCPSINSSTPKFGFSSSVSTETEHKKGNNAHNDDSTNDNPAKTSEEAKEIDQPGQAKSADQTEESGSISDLSMDDLIKRVVEKEELLEMNEKIQDKFVQTYAEMKNLTTQREGENSKNIATQNVAEDIGKALLVVKECLSKINASSDTPETAKLLKAATLLKALLESLAMTEKQYLESVEVGAIVEKELLQITVIKQLLNILLIGVLFYFIT